MTIKQKQRALFLQLLYMFDGSTNSLKFSKGTKESKLLTNEAFRDILTKIKIFTVRYGPDDDYFYLVSRVNPYTIKEQQKEIAGILKILGGLPKNDKSCKICRKKLFGCGIVTKKGSYHRDCLRTKVREDELLAKYPNVPSDVIMGLEHSWYQAEDGVDKLSSPYCVVFFDKDNNCYYPESCKTIRQVLAIVARNKKAKNNWELDSIYKNANLMAIE